MTRIQEALLLAAILLGLATLAAAGVVPAVVSQYAPLVMLPWIIRRQAPCARCEV